MGAPKWPPNPQRSERPGQAVALLGIPVNLATLGEENVRQHGEYVALVFEGRELTNVDQQRGANRFANALRRLSVAPDDRVVVMLPNGPDTQTVSQIYTAVWEGALKNYGPNLGYDYGGRLVAAWLDR